MSHEYTVEDVEYIRHEGKPYLATLYRPKGTGPFPIMVELHGGAWCRSDRHGDKLMHESMAKSGINPTNERTRNFSKPPSAKLSTS